MRVAIIGGTGHIGSYLTPRLFDAGHTVICVSRGLKTPYREHEAWRAIERVELDRAGRVKVNPDLSLPDSGKMPTMIRVLVTQVRPDKVKDYLELAKNEIIPGIKKSGLKDYSIAQSRFGEPNTVITSVVGFNNWADLDGGLGLEKGIGKEAYQSFLGKLTPLIVSSQFDVYRFRPDLSYLPPATAK